MAGKRGTDRQEEPSEGKLAVGGGGSAGREGK